MSSDVRVKHLVWRSGIYTIYCYRDPFPYWSRCSYLWYGQIMTAAGLCLKRLKGGKKCLIVRGLGTTFSQFCCCCVFKKLKWTLPWIWCFSGYSEHSGEHSFGMVQRLRPPWIRCAWKQGHETPAGRRDWWVPQQNGGSRLLVRTGPVLCCVRSCLQCLTELTMTEDGTDR